jgi:hypothetical protein
MSNIEGFKCTNCNKIFKRKFNLKVHCNTCKGEFLLPNQCLYCKKIYSSPSAKCKHLKICKHKPIEEIKEGNINNSYNNTTNNIYNDNSINITINNYNNTNLDYLTIDEKHKLVMKWLNEGLEGIILKSLVEFHFNVEHPENKNIRMNKTNFIEYLDDEKEYQSVPPISFFHKYVEKMEILSLDAIEYLQPKFKILCNLHKTVTPFLKWEDVGYDDSKDKNDIIYTKKEKKEVLSNIFKIFKRIIKNQGLLKGIY